MSTYSKCPQCPLVPPPMVPKWIWDFDEISSKGYAGDAGVQITRNKDYLGL